MTGRKPTIAVDFDGVIHSYISPWKRVDVIPDDPVPGAIEWLNEICQSANVVIFTTRAEHSAGIEAVRNWLHEYGCTCWMSAGVTAIKPSTAKLFIDDRAMQFDGEHFPSVEQVLAFEPWNTEARKRRAEEAALNLEDPS